MVTEGPGDHVTVLSVLVDAAFGLPPALTAISAGTVAVTVPLVVMPETATIDDVSQLSQSDSITVLTANLIVGQFSNVASGGRINSYSGFDIDNNPIGDPLGSFLVTYDDSTLVLSDFQPAEEAWNRKFVPNDPDVPQRRLLKR